MDLIFRAVADPARRAIVEALVVRDSQTLFELCTRLITERGMHMTRQAVSKHLGILRDAGVITVRSVGRTTIHHLEPAALAPLREWVEKITRNEQP